MDSTVHSHSSTSVYETITDSIILAIEQGASDFVMPWHGGGGAVGKPTNALTGATYRGINVVALWAEACVRGYGFGHWATYRQWATLGAQVRRGEQASTVVFYKKLEPSEPEDGEDTLTILLPHNQTDVDGQVAVDYLRAHVSTLGAVERLAGMDFFPDASGEVVEDRALWDVAGASFRSLVAAPCRRTAGAVIAEGSPRVFALP